MTIRRRRDDSSVNEEMPEEGEYGNSYISISHEQRDMDNTMNVHLRAHTSFNVHMKKYNLTKSLGIHTKFRNIARCDDIAMMLKPIHV